MYRGDEERRTSEKLDVDKAQAYGRFEGVV